MTDRRQPIADQYQQLAVSQLVRNETGHHLCEARNRIGNAFDEARHSRRDTQHGQEAGQDHSRG